MSANLCSSASFSAANAANAVWALEVLNVFLELSKTSLELCGTSDRDVLEETTTAFSSRADFCSGLALLAEVLWNSGPPLGDIVSDNYRN